MYHSPSIFSVVFHGFLIFCFADSVRARVVYRKHELLMALTDSFFLVGFIVLSGDFLWMCFSAIKFLPVYPDNLFLVVSVLGRDAVGMIFCYMLTRDKINEVLQLSSKTVFAYGFLLVFLAFHFGIAESPAWTDYTFAIRQGKSFSFVLSSFITTWIGGKVCAVVLVWSWLKRW